MWTQPDLDICTDEVYLAGEWVSSGTYKQVGSNREIWVEDEDVLPASIDGRVACYRRVQTWARVNST
jgi:hypothetical protein